MQRYYDKALYVKGLNWGLKQIITVFLNAFLLCLTREFGCTKQADNRKNVIFAKLIRDLFCRKFRKTELEEL